MEIHIKAIGILLISLAVIHAAFPRYFKWREELSTLSLINRQMMWVHTFFIAFTLLLTGVLCLLFSTDLQQSKLGRFVCFGLGLFWGIRLLFQFFVYSPSLWKGKRFETTIHVLFSLLWLYFGVVFFSVFLTDAV
ncbi:hypothetical protein [Sphingobacterium deserti]|uniref:Uncharacterized protein n=1 Tax=Sphingobacterium deserti TaxID=1229276 RepID=A0A0B8T0X6_9SPHI|nr:hypothetical protein [Sphingobacterium deserti]KGE14462.1 hypothetical protein DI53_1491 [Sphingobacterium deserti]